MKFGSNWREVVGQVLGIIQGLLYAHVGVLVVLLIKPIPALIKDTGVNTPIAFIWAGFFLLGGLLYAFAAFMRFTKPNWAFASAFSALCLLIPSVLIYLYSALSSFGYLSGLFTFVIGGGSVIFFINQLCGLWYTKRLVDETRAAPGGAHREMS